MAKEGKGFSLTRLLTEAGERILFQSHARVPVEKEETASTPTFREKLIPYKLKIKSALAKMTEQSFFLGLLRRATRCFFALRVSTFGIFFFTCGFLQILSFFLGETVRFLSGTEQNLVVGVCMIFLTLACSFSRLTVDDAIRKSIFFRKLFRSPPRSAADSSEEFIPYESVWTMLLAGTAVALLSVWFAPSTVLIGVLTVLIFFWILSRPEASLFLSVGCMFFLPEGLVIFFLIEGLFSFLFKCCIGRRSLLTSYWELLVLFALVPLFLSREGNLFSALALFSVFYLTAVLVNTTAQLHRFFRLVSVGVFFCALSAVLYWSLAAFFPVVLQRFPALEGIFFALVEENAFLFAITLPVIFGRWRMVKYVGEKVFCAITVLLSLLALYSIRSPLCWAAALLAVSVYLILRFRRGLLVFLTVGMVLIVTLYLLPTSLSLSFLSFFGLEGAPLIGEGAWMARELYLQTGVIGCILALSLPITFFITVFRFMRRVEERKDLYGAVLGALVSTVAFLFLFFTPASGDMRSIYFLAALTGLPTACLRIGQQEEIRHSY